MSLTLDEVRSSRRGVNVPTIWIAVAVSVLLHVAALWKMPQLRFPSSELTDRDKSGPLTVYLPQTPAPPPPRPRALPPLTPAPVPQSKPRAAPPPPPRPARPPIAMSKPAPDNRLRVPKAPATAAPTPPRPPAEGDMASYVEARRRARGESPPAEAPSEPAPTTARIEDENARANRLAMANLGAGSKPTFGYDPSKSGGVFTIQRLGFDYAEFVFLGWNKDARRNTAQVIEVRKGSNSDIRIAVVRRMIAIIREYEQTEFVWESRRLGRNVTLSARARDNAGLEDFLMREFF